jgi:hypothetical protein
MTLGGEYRKDVAAGLAGVRGEATPIAEEELAHLPEAVRRYLHETGVVGRPRVLDYAVRYTGELRDGPDAAWMKVAVEQQSFTTPAARHFLIRASLKGVPFRAYHRYVGDSATFRVRVLGLFEVVDAHGPEMNRSETVTLLNDMCLLAPATLIDPSIRWTEIGPREVRAEFTNAGNTVSAVLTFDERGLLADFVSDDRMRTTDGKTYERMQWSTPVRDWRFVDGRALPGVAEARWCSTDGSFAYARFDPPEIAYNVAGD